MAEGVLRSGHNHTRTVVAIGRNGPGGTPLPFTRGASLRDSPLKGENKRHQPTPVRLTNPSDTRRERSPGGGGPRHPWSAPGRTSPISLQNSSAPLFEGEEQIRASPLEGWWCPLRKGAWPVHRAGDYGAALTQQEIRSSDPRRTAGASGTRPSLDPPGGAYRMRSAVAEWKASRKARSVAAGSGVSMTAAYGSNAPV